MVKIDKFNEFNIENKTLYVFDFDDTLMVTPRYEDIAVNRNDNTDNRPFDDFTRLEITEPI